MLIPPPVDFLDTYAYQTQGCSVARKWRGVSFIRNRGPWLHRIQGQDTPQEPINSPRRLCRLMTRRPLSDLTNLECYIKACTRYDSYKHYPNIVVANIKRTIGAFPLLAIGQRVWHNILRRDSSMCALFYYRLHGSPRAFQLRTSCAPNKNIRDLPGYGWVLCAAGDQCDGLVSETEGGW